MNKGNFPAVLTPEGMRPVVYARREDDRAWCAEAYVGGKMMRGTGQTKLAAWTALAQKILDRVDACAKEKAPG